MDELIRFLQNLMQISNNQITQEYNQGRIINRELLPVLYRILSQIRDNEDEYIIMIMQRKRKVDTMPSWFKTWSEEVYEKKQPQWFKTWSEEVYEKKQPQWFKTWSEEVYEKKQPQWFVDWNKNVFEPRISRIESRLDAHDKMFKEHGWI